MVKQLLHVVFPSSRLELPTEQAILIDLLTHETWPSMSSRTSAEMTSCSGFKKVSL